MKIIEKYTTVWIEEAVMIYSPIAPMNNVYSFSCDRDGNIKLSELSEEAKKNLHTCRVNIHQYRSEFMDLSRLVHYPATGTCDNCNTMVEIFQGAVSQCYNCGQNYDENGNALDSSGLLLKMAS